MKKTCSSPFCECSTWFDKRHDESLYLRGLLGAASTPKPDYSEHQARAIAVMFSQRESSVRIERRARSLNAVIDQMTSAFGKQLVDPDAQPQVDAARRRAERN